MKLTRCGLPVLGLLALTLSLASAVRSQEQGDTPPLPDHSTEEFSEWGRAARQEIPPTHKGDWDGTWFYVNRDSRMVLWIRTEDGVPQVKFRYNSTASPEGFETDWNGNAAYDLPKAQGTFALNVSQRNADTIKGHWVWKLERGSAARNEEGDYTIYRTGDGRFLVVDFPEYTRTMVGASGKKRIYVAYPSWTFKKASKRIVLWDELPF